MNETNYLISKRQIITPRRRSINNLKRRNRKRSRNDHNLKDIHLTNGKKDNSGERKKSINKELKSSAILKQ